MLPGGFLSEKVGLFMVGMISTYCSTLVHTIKQFLTWCRIEITVKDFHDIEYMPFMSARGLRLFTRVRGFCFLYTDKTEFPVLLLAPYPFTQTRILEEYVAFFIFPLILASKERNFRPTCRRQIVAREQTKHDSSFKSGF